MPFDVLILGGAGQAKETLQLMRLIGLCREGSTVLLATREHEGDLLKDPDTGSFTGLVALGLGEPQTRLAVFRRWRSILDWPWPTLIHPRADLGDSTRVGQASMVASGVVTTCDVEIGDGVLVNTNVSVGHDVRLGDGSVVNPGATIGGGVDVGRGVLIGSGANILQGRSLGDGCVVGSGAVVTADVAAGTVVVGVPARMVSA